MLHCMASASTSTSSTYLTVFERQKAWLNSQQQQQQQESNYLSNESLNSTFQPSINDSHILHNYQHDHYDQLADLSPLITGDPISKKRKAERSTSSSPNNNTVINITEEECSKIEKRSKRDDAEITATISDHQDKRIKESTQKSDYIHVRARRGQATDSHSLAERVRREKISARMRYLQDLVPGCNRIAGKAGMLDEIINYVQSLQKQVEFLSMKLAVMNPRLDFNIDNLFNKEINAMTMMTTSDLIPGIIGMSTENSSVPIPEQFLDSSFNISSTWNNDLNCIYDLQMHQEIKESFHLYQGNLKMEI